MKGYWRYLVVLGATTLAIAGCVSGEAGSTAGESSTTVDPSSFKLGFVPAQRAEEITPDVQRLADFLKERMGREVEVLVPATYEPLIEGFRFAHLHAAYLDGGTAWIAHRRAGAAAILAEVRKNGEAYYWAEAFVRRDSPIESIDAIRGKRVAFTSRTGSSGFIMPIGSLIQSGMIELGGSELIHLEQALQGTFALTIEAGGYQQALVALLEDRVDVAFGAHDAPERFLSTEQRARIRTLHRFGRIPSHSVLVAANLAPSVVEQFRDAMLALNDSANISLLRAVYGVDGLKPATTEEHLGDFGRAVSALPGMEQTLLERTRN